MSDPRGPAPVSVFSPEPDLPRVVKALRELDPPAQLSMDGTDDAWQVIRMAWQPMSGEVRRLLVRTNPAYWARPAFDPQIAAMQTFFGRFGSARNTDARIQSLSLLGFAVSIGGDDQPDPDLHGDDSARHVVHAIATALDGIVFSVASFLDANMRALLGPHPDPDAVVPSWMIDSPTAGRVARRCMLLAALGHRADLELDPSNPAARQATAERIRLWLDKVGAGDEIEPADAIIDEPVGALDETAITSATSRLEGLGMLAWSLQLVDLPTDDMLLGPPDVLPRLAYLDADRAARIVAGAVLRPDEELVAVWNHQRYLHWRLEQFKLRPEPIAFADQAKEGWFAHFQPEEFALVDGDLAIGGVPIHLADPELRERVHRAAYERHLASSWLLRGGTYDGTDLTMA